ncbi:probable cytochrome P450 304a1 [Schistocerca serialis cubense]|uniref:probable cytochrome P450 304a1 n=1 Tax=Schistocerca serialis cubense TaxID=2023355 RepID=UPI00214F1ED4|nr:probable cytochrome P450 304a1 [Schistocerca serialis cubense]
MEFLASLPPTLLPLLSVWQKTLPVLYVTGPPRLPIWGSYIELLLENYKFPYKVMDAFKRRYNSKLVGLYFGPLPVVVINDYEAAKEAFNKPSLQGRISNIAIKQRMPHEDLDKHCINFRVGPELMEQRRFTLRYLRDFGFGRRSDHLESEIEAEMAELVELIRGERQDEPSSGGDSSRRVLLPDALFPGFINGFMPVVAGSRLPRTADGVCRYLGHAGLQTAGAGDATGGFLTLHSALASIAPKMSGYHDTVESAEKILTYFHQVFLSTADQLGVILFDTFLPASMVQSTVLSWALLYVARHPEAQRRAQLELDSVVGNSRLPNLNDRLHLPYTEAILRETMRMQTLLPIGIPHAATENTTLQGYSIPKGTVVIANLWSMHMDKSVWGDPENFRPERFLNSDGTLCTKDLTLPFSTGKRVCPGETFARQNMFLMLATLLQNFSVRADGLPPLHCNIPGAIETPPAFWAQFEPRCEGRWNQRGLLEPARAAGTGEGCWYGWNRLARLETSWHAWNWLGCWHYQSSKLDLGQAAAPATSPNTSMIVVNNP